MMRRITWSSYLEHVEEGDWLWVRSVTFNKKGVPWIFQFVKRFKDTDVTSKRDWWKHKFWSPLSLSAYLMTR